MKGIVLAAGRGSRMGHMTSDQPKCMTELGGKTLFDWQRHAMGESGIQDIGVVCGYLRETFESFPVHRFCNERWAETNMVRSLMCADPWLSQDDCVVSYSDIIYEPDAVGDLLGATGDIVVAYHTGWRALWERRFDDPLSDAETFRVNEQGHLIEIGERAKSMDEIKGQYMGLIKFTPQGWANVYGQLKTYEADALDRLDMTSLLRHLMENDVTIDTVPLSGLWYEVDSESDFRLYQSDFI